MELELIFTDGKKTELLAEGDDVFKLKVIAEKKYPDEKVGLSGWRTLPVGKPDNERAKPTDVPCTWDLSNNSSFHIRQKE